MGRKRSVAADRRVVAAVACPHCGAAVGQVCKRPGCAPPGGAVSCRDRRWAARVATRAAGAPIGAVARPASALFGEVFAGGERADPLRQPVDPVAVRLGLPVPPVRGV